MVGKRQAVRDGSRRRQAGPVTAAFALCCIACDPGNGRTAVPDSAAGPTDFEVRFTRVEDSGVALVNVSGDSGKESIVGSVGQGAAALDYDLDGRLDLFVANGGRFDGEGRVQGQRPALYRNLGGLRFEDVTVAAGLDVEQWAHGAWRVDFDADGRPDLYLTVYGGPNRFFRNRGDGGFEEVTSSWGGADPGPSTAAVFFDADGDGDLDLYVGNYVEYDPLDPPNGGLPCEWRGLQVMCGPVGTRPAPDTFWANRDGRLVRSRDAGFGQVPATYTLGGVAADFDDDGDLDLYLANDSEPNYYFENADGSFRERALLLGLDRNRDGRPQAGMGVDAGDLDNDGHLDLFVTNFSHDSNTLYLSSPMPTGLAFEDATYEAALGLESYPYLSWGVRLVDLDRDGWLDLLIASGHVYPQLEGRRAGTSYAQPNQFFRSLGTDRSNPLRFEAPALDDDDGLEAEGVSRGLVAADLDEDGDLDLLIVEIEDTPKLLRNDSRGGGQWIGFRLRGEAPNTEAIGARLAVTDSLGKTRILERTAGGSYLSSGDPRLLVGLADARGTVEVAIRWPSGERQVLTGLEPGRYHELSR